MIPRKSPPSPRCPAPRGLRATLSTLAAAACLAALPAACPAVTLKGSNGNEVNFAGVLEARPEGLQLMVKPGGKTILVPWGQFDLLDMELNQPKIFQASKDTVRLKKPITLRLGVYANLKTYDELVDELTSRMNQTYRVKVPQFEYYWDEDYEYERYFGGFKYDPSGYGKKKASVLARYKSFLGEMFPGKDIEVTGNSRYLGSDPEPSKKTVEITSKDLLAYFSDRTIVKRGDAVTYVQRSKDVLRQPMEILKDVQRRIPNATFDEGNADHNSLPKIIGDVVEQMEKLQTQKAFNRGATRDFAKLLKLIEDAERRR